MKFPVIIVETSGRTSDAVASYFKTRSDLIKYNFDIKLYLILIPKMCRYKDNQEEWKTFLKNDANQLTGANLTMMLQDRDKQMAEVLFFKIYFWL